jgi:hypothetical protein
MSVNWQDLNLAVTALGAPFQRMSSFIRAALLPFLICMAVPVFLTLLEAAYPHQAAAPSTPLPVYVQGLGFLLLGLVLLSVVSFSINWRRALGLTEADRGAASLLNIDARVIVYVLGQFRSTAQAGPAKRRNGHWTMNLLRMVGFMLLMAVFVLGFMIAFITALVVFRPEPQTLTTGSTMVSAVLFVAFFFSPYNWRQNSIVALDLVPGQPLNAPRSAVLLGSAPIQLAASVLFCTLGLTMPSALMTMPSGPFLLTVAAWIAALFLTIGWMAAAETLLALRYAERRPEGDATFRSQPPRAVQA